MSEWETITVEIHNMTEVVERSFAAKFRPLNLGCEVTLDEAGVKLAQRATELRINNASNHNRQLKYGFTEDGHVVGCFAEFMVVALTGLTKWIVVPGDLGRGKCKSPDVGRTVQVRGSATHHYLCLHPDDPENVPWVFASVHPPSPVGTVYGWAWGHEVKQSRNWGDHWGRNQPCFRLHSSQLHDLCDDLPEDAMAWLRCVPRGCADVIKLHEQEQQDGRLQF